MTHPTRPTHTRATGAHAEDRAVRWLTRQGYEIVARNLYYKPGELDAVAMDRDTLCFIEIKFRTRRDFGPAIAAVNRRKQLRIASAASLYLAETCYDGACRFDVLGIHPEGDDWEYDLIRGAFEAP